MEMLFRLDFDCPKVFRRGFDNVKFIDFSYVSKYCIHQLYDSAFFQGVSRVQIKYVN